LTTSAIVLSLFAVFPASQELEYLGWFAGKVEIRAAPLPGYYYDPYTVTPLKALMASTPVEVKVFDGGSLCPNLTRYKVYQYSPAPLPGYYLLPNAGKRMYPMLPVGWPLRPISSLGVQQDSAW
jgi:hypothetical protein